MKTLLKFSKVFKLLFIGITPLVLFSCEDPINVDLEVGETLLVVDGWITDQPGPHKIILSTTSSYFNNDSTPRVRGAEISILDSEGKQEVLTETQTGHYQTSSTFQAKVGQQYTLQILFEGQKYSATTEIRRPVIIDSLNQTYKDKTMIEKEGYFVLYNGPELGGLGDFYQFKIYKNNSLMNKVENLVLVQDRLIDGLYLKDVQLHHEPFQIEDNIRIETWSITEDAFYYYQEMKSQLNNGGMFSYPVANIRTNIKNAQTNNQMKAIGYFGGASVASKEIVIR